MYNTAMPLQKHQRKKGLMFAVLAVMLSVFCVLKVLRGSDNESTQQGGIWNYISLLYYPIFIGALFTKHAYRIQTLFVAAIIYIVLALLSLSGHDNGTMSVAHIYTVLMIPYAMLVLFCFYLWADSSRVSQQIILAGYYMCLALNLYTVCRFRFANGPLAQESDIYFSLGLFPFALQFVKNKKLRMILIVLEFLAVFLVNKRTALISFVVALVCYILVDTRVTNVKKIGKSIKTMVIIAVVLVVFYNFSMYLDSKYDLEIYDRLFRLTEDGGSGRDQIYSKIWDGFRNSSLIEQLFGHGMNTAGKVGGAGQAHNDFLEVLYDYGVFAAVSLAVFFLSLIAAAIHMVKVRSPYAAAFVFAVIVGLCLSLFSYFIIFYTYVTCIMAFWGYALKMENDRLMSERGVTA